MKRSKSLAAGFSLIVLASAVIGQPARPPLEEVYQRVDTNKDGKLSPTEFAALAKFSPRLKDGKIKPEQIFDRLDRDNDGFLSPAEFLALANLMGKKDKDEPAEDPKAKPKEKAAPAKDAPLTQEQIAFFEKKIRPVLVEKCYSCHAADAKKIRGGLRLDTRETLLAGGDSGPVIVVGQPGKSLLIKALKGDGVDVMPPKEKLPAPVIADFEKWVSMGAPDPRTEGGAKPEKAGIDITKGREHWAFQPVKNPPLPAVADPTWAVSPIDRFILSTLTAKKLTPAKDADRRTLIRRVTFDLTGLPPTAAEVETFVNDTAPDAYDRLVDRLLASPAFGEKWGRHWLDVARYAESSGKEVNILYPFAWRYRDYVIAAFNADKPYDQFLKEQLAGDLLPAKNDTEKAEHLIATGFLAIGPKSHNERNPMQFRLDLADEQIDAVSQGMLGLTVSCARCHDHKFDPIPTKDYYALAGIFLSTDTRFGTPSVLQARNSAPPIDLPTSANVPVGPSQNRFELERTKTRLADLKKQREEAQTEARKDGQPPLRLLFLTSQIAVLEFQLSHYTSDGTPKKLAMGVNDRSVGRDSPVYIRGELDRPGESVTRGFLQVLHTPSDPKITTGSGRKELAEWVASPNNPLTSRVMVNRVWQTLFGRGLVATPDNFGVTGQAPSHPELLDHLANGFIRDGWSIKKLVRSMVTSHTYRMASDYHAGNAQIDPENVYLWRMSKRRLDAEAIRDSMYAISGQLDKTPANGSPIAKVDGPTQVVERFFGFDRLTDTNHRSVYIPVVRDHVPESLTLFDFAEPSLVTGTREDTSVPAQGLFLLNNPQVLKLSEKTAERLQKEYLSETERIDGAFRMILGRPATAKEAAGAAKFLSQFAESNTKTGRAKANGWAALAQSLFATAEFRYLD